MKKIILTLTLLWGTLAGFSQVIKPVKIDSLVTVSLPDGYNVKDTLTQRIYTANSLAGFMTVIRTANEKNNTPLKKEKDLNKVLVDYANKIQAQSNGGRAVRLRDTVVGTLKAKNFTLKSEDNSGNVQLINFTLIYTQDATYTFEYVYPQNDNDAVKADYKAFISSIKLSPQLQRNDQYLSNDNGMSAGAKIGIFGGAGLLVVLVIVFTLKRKSKFAV